MTVFDRYQLTVARKTLSLSDSEIEKIGVITKKEAVEIIQRLKHHAKMQLDDIFYLIPASCF